MFDGRLENAEDRLSFITKDVGNMVEKKDIVAMIEATVQEQQQ